MGTSRRQFSLPLCTPPDQEVSIGELMSGGLVSYQGNQHRVTPLTAFLKSTVTSWGLPTAGIGLAKTFVWIFCDTLLENPTELFGQPDTLLTRARWRDETGKRRSLIYQEELSAQIFSEAGKWQ